MPQRTRAAVFPFANGGAKCYNLKQRRKNHMSGPNDGGTAYEKMDGALKVAWTDPEGNAPCQVMFRLCIYANGQRAWTLELSIR